MHSDCLLSFKHFVPVKFAVSKRGMLNGINKHEFDYR